MRFTPATLAVTPDIEMPCIRCLRNFIADLGVHLKTTIAESDDTISGNPPNTYPKR
jgi:uncharacterized metal-binding protein YceD (DUF177 family)